MDLLNIGTKGRKTNIAPRDNVRRDEYNMEDVDEFFAEDKDNTIASKSSGKQLNYRAIGTASPSSRLNVVARKIDFTQAESDSFHFTPPVLHNKNSNTNSVTGIKNINNHNYNRNSNNHNNDDDNTSKNSILDNNKRKNNTASTGATKQSNNDDAHTGNRSADNASSKSGRLVLAKKTKKSPLRSPLQERQRLGEEIRHLDDNDFYEDNNINDNDDNYDYGDFSGKEDYNDPNAALLPIPVESLGIQSSTKVSSRGASLLTKSMALGNSSRKRRPPPTIYASQQTQEEGIESELDDSLDEFIPLQAPLHSSFADSRAKNTKKMTKPSPLPSPPPDGLRRSKRTKIPPVAFWKGEKVFYTRVSEDSDDPDNTLANDIKFIPLQQIGGVEQPVSVASSSRASSTNASSVSSKKKPRLKPRQTRKNNTGATFMDNVNKKVKNDKTGEYDYESDPEIPGSEWFKDKLLNLNVFYEPESDLKTRRKIAWAPNSEQYQKPNRTPDSNSYENIQVATLFNEDRDFVASGMLLLPKEGLKLLSPTMDNAYIFHVIKGLVEVTVNDSTFVVTKGSSFNVPRNNVYGLKNLGMIEAKIFFVQARPQGDEIEIEEENEEVWIQGN